MKASDELHKLIRSLTRSEKRYFKLHSSLHAGEKIYLKLFDVIEKMEVYEEEKIKKKFRGQTFIKQLTFTKNYLSNLILKSMRAYRSKESVEIQLQEMLSDARFLFEKGLFVQSAAVVKKAKKLGTDNESFTYLIELAHWHVRLNYALNYKNISLDDIEKQFNELYETIDKHKNFAEYVHQQEKYNLTYIKQGVNRDRKYLQLFKEIIDHPIYRSETYPLTVKAKYLFHSGHFFFSFQNNDLMKVDEHLSKQVELLEEHPFPSMLEGRYIDSLSNLMACQVYLKKFTDAEKTIEKLKGIETRSERLSELIFYSVRIAEITLHNLRGEFEKGIKLVERTEKEMRSRSLLTAYSELDLNYTIAVLFFGAGKYNSSLKYLNRILNDRSNIRHDIYCFAKIFALVVHYELDNRDLLEYMVRSVYRYLSKRNNLHQFENIILSFIRQKMPKVNSPFQMIGAFKELKKEIELMSQNVHEHKALDYFDYISWLESKIEKRPFAVIVKRKAADAS